MKIVMNLREKIKNRVTIECEAAGVNKRRVIQRAVYEELVNMLSPVDVQPFKPVRGRSNVIMFVGLQVAAFSAVHCRARVKPPQSASSLPTTSEKDGEPAWCAPIRSEPAPSTN